MVSRLMQVDQVINRMARRPADLVARCSEEFAIILPNTTPKGAVHVTESIRTAIKEAAIPHTESVASSYVTLSL